MSSYFQLTLTLKGSLLEEVEAVLFELGALSITLLPLTENDSLLLETEYLYERNGDEHPVFKNAKLQALFEKPIQLPKALQKTASWEECTKTSQDYIKEQQESLQSIPLGDFLITPSILYETLSPSQKEKSIAISPAFAFGTGEHPTTYLCLEHMNLLDLKGGVGVDLGSGSGILSFFALKKGAKCMHAYEIDPLAMDSAKQNAALMNISNAQFIMHHADEPLPKQVDFVFANIYTKVLLSLGERLQRLQKQGASLFLSGVLTEQAHNFILEMSPWVSLQLLNEKEGWVLLGDKK